MPALERVRRLARLLGFPGGAWLALTALAAVWLAAVESLVALFLQVFLVVIGLVPESGAPPWIVDLEGRLSLTGWIGAMILIGLARALGYFLVGQGGTVASEHVNLRLRLRTAREVFLRRQPLPPAVAAHRLAEVIPRAAIFALSGSQFVALLVVLLLVAAGAFALAPREAALAFVGLVPVGLVSIGLAGRITRHAGHLPGRSRRLADAVQRITRNWLFIRVTGTEGQEFVGFRRSATDYFTSLVRSSAWAQAIAALPPFAGVVLLGAVVLASQTWFGTPGITLVALLYLLVRAFHVLRELAHHGGTMFRFLPHFQEAFDELSGPLDGPAAPPSPAVSSGRTAGDDPPSIEFDRVSFTYPGQATAAVTDLSFSLAPGGKLGVIGPSGAGKTTLLGLLLGVLPPRAGRIEIGRRPAEDYLRERRDSIGLVAASPYLVDGTIRDNLLYGLSEPVADRDLLEALRFADLDQTTERLADGLDHRVDAEGHGLSAGQLQRLSLARAVLRRPGLLVLDEPSANLDERTEASLARNLDSLAGRTTLVVVSHRPGLLRDLDVVVDLGRCPEPALT